MFSATGHASTTPKIGLHSFKAGRLTRVEGTNRVKPDPRKGLIYLQEVDELLHFYWKDRNGGVEDDLIIFPEEAEFIKVQESPSGRVFALKFSSSSQIMFYWMQEKDAANDEADVRRVNDLIADPKAVAPSTTNGQGSGLAGLTGLGGTGNAGQGILGSIDLSAAAQTMGLSQEQLVQILGHEDLSQLIGPGGQNLFGTSASGTAATGDVFDSTGIEATAEQMALDPVEPAVPSGEGVASAGQEAAIAHINDGNEAATSQNTAGDHNLRELLAGIQVPAGGQGQEASDAQLSLQDVLTPEQILPLLADSSIRSQLFPHLPRALISDPPLESEVREIMSSVQWRQALSGLSYALNHGGESIIRSLGIDTSQLEGSSGVEAFLRAVSQAMQKEQEGDHDRMEE